MPLCFMTFVSVFFFRFFLVFSLFSIINYLRKVFEERKKKMVDETSLFMRRIMMMVMNKTMWELWIETFLYIISG